MPSRNEQYLEAAVNKSGTDGLPEPRTRNEKLLHRLVEEVSSGGLPEGGTPYHYLVTDGDGNAKWEDRLAYESIAEIDITGLEIEFPLVSKGADVSVPLELGQKWNLVVEDSRVQQNIDSSNPYEVKKNDEGILYIGADPSVNVINGNVRYDIVSITKSKAYYSQSFCSAVGYSGNMKIVGVSGVFTGEVVKTIDSKYIPADYINSLIDAKLGVIENGSY